MDKNIFISVVGFKNYFGNSVFVNGEKVLLRKEPDNMYDKEAIAVEVDGYGVCGYVSNSPTTTLRGTKRASRIYDTFNSCWEAKVVYSSFDNVVCSLNVPYENMQKNMLKGKNLSVYLEKTEDERYAFSILYDDESETKVAITIKNDEKETILHNILLQKDFKMIFSKKLKTECFFREHIIVKFSLVGNVNAFAEVFVSEKEELEKFFI